ncbi:MAG: DUF4345 family protein [Polyangiaceae bacterium]
MEPATSRAHERSLPELVLGLAIAAAGVVLVFRPMWIATTFSRPHETVSQQINLRATWGGTVAGLGAFLATRPPLRPRAPLLATLLLTTMACIGAARVVGFALDGRPDTLQLVWIVAEVALSGGALAYLIRRRSAR